MKIEMGNINIYYMTPEQIKIEFRRMAKYIDGGLFMAMVVTKDNMKFIIVLN